MPQESPRVRVTEIGEYIRHHSCERRFKLEFNGRQAAQKVPFYSRFFNPIDPVLQEAGRLRENEWEKSLKEADLSDLTQYSARPPEDKDKSTSWEEFLDQVQSAGSGQLAYGREISVEADLGAFQVAGQIDFVLLRWGRNKPKLWIVECKASRRDRTYHRVQVTLYRMLVRQLIEYAPVTIGGILLEPESIECVVARIDESTSEIQAILQLEPLRDLEREEADIARLLAPNGPLIRITKADLSDLDYQLNMKCDGCVFNVHCLPESGIGRCLELLGIEPSLVRVLRDAGISSLDDLVNLDLMGAQASQIREVPGFTASLDVLHQKARARRRTLPGGDTDPDTYEVESLPHFIQGQLPEHEIDGHRLVRVYLAVDYDYVENRIAALSAHVTTSDGQIHTGFIQKEDGSWQLNPEIKERWEVGRDENNRPIYDEDAVYGKTVIQCVSSIWTGRYEVDTGVERQLIQGFLHELVDAIAEVARAEEAPIHFYVWSRTEMTRLVEACSRVDSSLLSHLRELLGCRESLDQLIYSCLRNEVDQRYALGWTGRGLSVVTSLMWFGRRYHWRRRVAGTEVDLDDVFTQDIFDFKTDLDLRSDGGWAINPVERVTRHKFEIRSRFYDSLTAPYWRAYWRVLPDPGDPGHSQQVKDALRRYKASERPGYLKAYLEARVHALRWIEERIRYKNPDITKPLMTIAELPDFTLGVETTAQAAIDFLRLDQHVSTTDWIADHLVPPVNRVPLGHTIPVMDIRSLGRGELTAMIDLGRYGIDLDTLNVRCTISEGSFTRLSPYSGDPHRGQTLGQLARGGITCVIRRIDWETGQIMLNAWYMNPTRYTLQSWSPDPGDVFDYATIDENISDFVAGKVEERLQSDRGTHVYQWFDPEDPQIPEYPPITEPDKELYRELLEALILPNGQSLVSEQVAAAIDGLDTRVQLLQGPPGTGKTVTTAASMLLRILARRRVGDIVLVAANTHTALDNLLQRTDTMLDDFCQKATDSGLPMPSIRLVKVHSSEIGSVPGGRILDFRSTPCVRDVNRERRDAVLVVGGTTNALLKMTRELSRRPTFTRNPIGFQTPMLIIDEASMLVFPHFLALATLVAPDGEIMLAGDHRQLAPIVAHDWEREDRPPVILYQPFVSAYQAIQNIARNRPGISEQAIRRSALEFTFRLPPVIRELIARLYRLDDIELEGLAREPGVVSDDESGSWERVWQGETGLYLALHSERRSRRSNEVEAQIIEQIITAGGDLPNGSVAIVTPYRAQRSMLQTRLANYEGPVDLIDTVERLQGGERPIVIVSATASDHAAISTNVEFILNLNRSNVAFSRAQDRLIVVCSEELINHIPAEVDQYDSAMLWKSMRSLCSRLVATIDIGEHIVRIFTPPLTMGSSSN